MSTFSFSIARLNMAHPSQTSMLMGSPYSKVGKVLCKVAREKHSLLGTGNQMY